MAVNIGGGIFSLDFFSQQVRQPTGRCVQYRRGHLSPHGIQTISITFLFLSNSANVFDGLIAWEAFYVPEVV